MSIEIGKGLPREERNRAIRKATEILEANREFLYEGGRISIFSNYEYKKGTRHNVKKVFRLEKEFATLEDYTNFKLDINQLKEEVRKFVGYSTSYLKGKYENKTYKSYFDSEGYEPTVHDFPSKFLAYISLLLNDGEEESKIVEEMFENQISKISQKYNMEATARGTSKRTKIQDLKKV